MGARWYLLVIPILKIFFLFILFILIFSIVHGSFPFEIGSPILALCSIGGAVLLLCAFCHQVFFATTFVAFPRSSFWTFTFGFQVAKLATVETAHAYLLLDCIDFHRLSSSSISDSSRGASISGYSYPRESS